MKDHYLMPVYQYLTQTLTSRTGVIPDRTDVIDLGGGNGFWAYCMLDHGFKNVTIVDNDAKAVEDARQNLSNAFAQERWQTITADVSSIPVPDASFDVAVSRSSMHFWPDLPAAWRELARIVRPGGYVLSGRGFGPDLPDEIRASVKAAKYQDLYGNSKAEHKEPGSLPAIELRKIAADAGFSTVAIIPDHKAYWILARKNPSESRKDTGSDSEIACDYGPDKWLKSKYDFELRPEPSDFELGAKKVLWTVFAVCFAIFLFFASENGEPVVRKDSILLLKGLANWLILSSHSGATALIDFLSTHLISAMVPAFFLAAAISTFFSKETIIMAIGKKSNPLVSYPLAAFGGAILTVCSCGVLPIFMSLLQSGAGLGPAITFLYASPAINLISIIYTWKIIPAMLWVRIFAVAICAIAIGWLMNKIFADMPEEFENEELKIKPSKRKAWQEAVFFLLLVAIMLTSTDLFSGITNKLIPASVFAYRGEDVAIKTAHLAGKLLALAGEIILVIITLRLWFTWDDTRKWLKRSYRQARSILPMVILGIFFSGFLGGTSALVSVFSIFADNSLVSNLSASLIGAMLYFGSIVGVNVVDLFMRWGMHHGPALALLLAGPSISLPSVLALMPIMGKRRTAVFLALVVVFTTVVGLLFGAFGSMS